MEECNSVECEDEEMVNVPSASTDSMPSNSREDMQQPPVNHQHNEASAELVAQVHAVADDIIEKSKDPECEKAVLEFLKSYRKLKSIGAWKSAMHCFNKQNLSQSSLQAIRRKYMLQRKRGYAGKSIPVQPTAIARRKAGISRGRSKTAAGRPSKGRQANAATTNRPHNLAYCVNKNIPVGKKHSKVM